MTDIIVFAGQSNMQGQTEKLLDEFETVIYPSNTASFGTFRDLGGDGKLHIVVYAMKIGRAHV